MVKPASEADLNKGKVRLSSGKALIAAGGKAKRCCCPKEDGEYECCRICADGTPGNCCWSTEAELSFTWTASSNNCGQTSGSVTGLKLTTPDSCRIWKHPDDDPNSWDQVIFQCDVNGDPYVSQINFQYEYNGDTCLAYGFPVGSNWDCCGGSESGVLFSVSCGGPPSNCDDILTVTVEVTITNNKCCLDVVDGVCQKDDENCPNNAGPPNACDVPCADCYGNTDDISAVITATGACEDDGGATCGDLCGNATRTLEWDAVNEYWEYAGTTPYWLVRVWCENDVWYIRVEGGCWESDGFTDAPTAWQTTFNPEGCVQSGATGYPTHSGIDMGNPVTEHCWTTCALTVSLS